MNQFARPGLGVTELPSFNENDKGKVLTINSESGVLGWEEGSGGGSSGGGVLVVNMVDEYTDKTWKEIYDAPMAVIVEESSIPGIGTSKLINIVARVIHNGSEYSVFYYVYSISTPSEYTIDEIKLVTDSENGYLTWAE